MHLYNFKFHECDGTTSDVDSGVRARDIGVAREIAIERAREIMAGEVRKGRLCMSCWIVVSDENGNNVMTLQFGDAVQMVVEPPCGHHDGGSTHTHA